MSRFRAKITKTAYFQMGLFPKLLAISVSNFQVDLDLSGRNLKNISDVGWHFLKLLDDLIWKDPKVSEHLGPGEEAVQNLPGQFWPNFVWCQVTVSCLHSPTRGWNGMLPFEKLIWFRHQIVKTIWNIQQNGVIKQIIYVSIVSFFNTCLWDGGKEYHLWLSTNHSCTNQQNRYYFSSNPFLLLLSLNVLCFHQL